MNRPLIGLTVENAANHLPGGRYESNVGYSRMVAQAGGIPLLLPQELSLVDQYVELCDGLILTGGNDARPEIYGEALHPQACCIEPERQAFELALLDALAKKQLRPTLGICLGMQLMALHAGGKMNQHLPDTLAQATEVHQDNHAHSILLRVKSSVLLSSPLGSMVESLVPPDFSSHTVVSSHHQGVTSAGRLRVIATSPDGVIEAIDDPTRPFYLGVQWHPERDVGLLNFELIQRFVAVCAASRA